MEETAVYATIPSPTESSGINSCDSSCDSADPDLSHVNPCPAECQCRHVLHGARFVVSGFFTTDRDRMKRICRKIRLMGGKTLRGVDSNTTHVLVGKIGRRAREAAQQRINCFRPAYIDRCWEERHVKDFMAAEEGFVRDYLVRVPKHRGCSRRSSLSAPSGRRVSLSSSCVRRSFSRCSPRQSQAAGDAPPLPPRAPDKADATARKKKLQQRNHLINELVETERTYIVLLDFVAKHYVTALQEQMKQRISPMKADYAAAVFGPWKDLYSLHGSLLASLQENLDYSCAALPGSSIVPSVGGTFLTHLNAFSRIYPEYITSFERRKDFYTQSIKSDSVFRAFIQARRKLTAGLPVGSESSSLKKQTLHDMLIGPVQRLPRYMLLLDGILATTPDGHTDKADIASAVTSIKAINEKINELKTTTQGEERLHELEEQIEGAPAYPDSARRWVVSEADVTMIENEHRAGYRCDLPVKVLVLPDCLVIALCTYSNRKEHLTHYLTLPYSRVLWFCRYLRNKTDPAGLPDMAVHYQHTDPAVKKTLYFSCERSTTTSVTILLSSMSKAAYSDAKSRSEETRPLLTTASQNLPAWISAEPFVPGECAEPTPLKNITNTGRMSDTMNLRLNPKRKSKTEAMLRLMTPDRRSKRHATPTKPTCQYEPGSTANSARKSIGILSAVSVRRRASSVRDYKPPEPIPYQPSLQSNPTPSFHQSNSTLARRDSLLSAVQSGGRKLTRRKSILSNKSTTFFGSSKSTNRSMIATASSTLSLPGVASSSAVKLPSSVSSVDLSSANVVATCDSKAGQAKKKVQSVTSKPPPRITRGSSMNSVRSLPAEPKPSRSNSFLQPLFGAMRKAPSTAV